MSREEALRQIKIFRDLVNSGVDTSNESWEMIMKLMDEFKISLEELR